MKKDQYFNLEVNFLSTDNIVRMMMELDAAQSLGIYMMLLTHLRKADNYEASCCPLCMGAFARMYDLDAGVLQPFCARRRTANVPVALSGQGDGEARRKTDD